MTHFIAYFHDRTSTPQVFELLTTDGWIVVNETEYLAAWNQRKGTK